jgi:hypothetical protein
MFPQGKHFHQLQSFGNTVYLVREKKEILQSCDQNLEMALGNQG